MPNHKTKLIEKIDPIKYLIHKESLMGRLAKWLMILINFDIEYVDIKIIKGQVIANQLEDAQVEMDNPILSKFLLESIFVMTTSIQWKLYFDRSYTQHRERVGNLFIKP